MSELSYLHFNEDDYNLKFIQKVTSFLESLKCHEYVSTSNDVLTNRNFNITNSLETIDYLGSCELIRSPKRHCRQRVRFQIIKPEHSESGFQYAMWDHGGPNAIIKEFPIASREIYDMMPALLEEINTIKNDVIVRGIQAVSFLSSTLGEMLITLIYNCDITQPLNGVHWDQSASVVRERLLQKQIERGSQLKKLSIIGRSRGKKQVIGSTYVMENLHLDRYDGRTLLYKQIDDGFSNPNSSVNMKALDWLCKVVQESILPHLDNLSAGSDLLEMYCGNGNHTVALAAYFRGIMAIELNHKLCKAAKENLVLNNVSNVRIKTCDSSKFANYILNYRSYSYYPVAQEEGGSFDGIDGPMHFQFGAVLVDPPRAGLDSVTLKAISNYNNILYISCNPLKLLENLVELSKTHELTRMAAFDHFAYTDHLEVGVLLQRRELIRV